MTPLDLEKAPLIHSQPNALKKIVLPTTVILSAISAITNFGLIIANVGIEITVPAFLISTCAWTATQSMYCKPENNEVHKPKRRSYRHLYINAFARTLPTHKSPDVPQIYPA